MKSKQTHYGHTITTETDSTTEAQSTECAACRGTHENMEECPAKRCQGKKRKKPDHFAKMCRTQTQQRKTKYKLKKVHVISNSIEQASAELYIDTVTKLHANSQRTGICKGGNRKRGTN